MNQLTYEPSRHGIERCPLFALHHYIAKERATGEGAIPFHEVMPQDMAGNSSPLPFLLVSRAIRIGIGMKNLAMVLAQEDSVLFIGSGVSLWSGLPSWPTLIEELAQFVEAAGVDARLVRGEAKRGELLQAASYGFDKLTKHQIGDFVRKACRFGVAKPHEIHRKLVLLGPRCFITTNYDNLIEESLRTWQPDRFIRPPVTNRHLTETAEIVHARAIDFVFKPHGDAADSDSIILTREQYRQLLPGGARQNVLESLKTLLLTRPIVYVGFGLRDPDFLYVRDLLANTYKGGTRDHFAIMGDVSDAESDYWRRNYGIHLVAYPTTARPDGSRDHTPLLTLLDKLLEETPPIATSTPLPGTEACGPEFVLSLARHAARLLSVPRLQPEFHIQVHAEVENSCRDKLHFQPGAFDDYPVERFLEAGPGRALLIGLPGAGKTYALQRAAARLAEELHQACLTEPFDSTTLVVPIFADLKLYRGDFLQLIRETLPKSLPFDDLSRRFKLRIFLDSFNEMPREYRESGFYETDFVKFTAAIGNASLVVGSRTTDGLLKLGLTTYVLDQIDIADVEAELSRLGVSIGGRLEREVRSLLQKPFYFQLLANGRIALPSAGHPRDIYVSFFGNLRQEFESRFGSPFDLETALSLAAYDAIERGEEAYPLSDLLRVLRTSVASQGLSGIDIRDIANWLVSASVLMPHSGGRVAFVHQSITEYLAANELARRYRTDPRLVREKLKLTRWDQALFMALSLLPSSLANAFLQDVIKADFVVALQAVKYVDIGRDELVSQLLAVIPDRLRQMERTDYFGIESAIAYSLPVSEAHEPQLRVLMKCRNLVGAAAAQRLVEMKGSAIKEEMLRMFVEAPEDFNFCTGIARALKPFVTNEDIHTLAVLAQIAQDGISPGAEADSMRGFVSGAAELLGGLDLDIVKEEFLPKERSREVGQVQAEILCNTVRDHHSTAGLELAGDLLIRGLDEAATAIYFIGEFSECVLSWASFTVGHVSRLVSIIQDSADQWALQALRILCSTRPDLAGLVKDQAGAKSGIARAALLHCAADGGTADVFGALGELQKMSQDQRRNEPMNLLEGIELNWAGKEELFVQLFKLRDTRLASALLGGRSPFEDESLGKLNIMPVDYWLAWMLDLPDDESAFWFRDRMGSLLARYGNREGQEALLTEFNRSGSKFRKLLMNSVLPHWIDLTTTAFSEEAISFLLADLSRSGSVRGFRAHLLGRTATEHFVLERLMPLLTDASPPLLENLKVVLNAAGQRHGRRYLTE